jgi:hypothetical protein
MSSDLSTPSRGPYPANSSPSNALYISDKPGRLLLPAATASSARRIRILDFSIKMLGSHCQQRLTLCFFILTADRLVLPLHILLRGL